MFEAGRTNESIPVCILMTSGFSAASDTKIPGRLVCQRGGFTLDWTQPSTEKAEPDARYQMSFDHISGHLTLVREEGSRMMLDFCEGKNTSGTLSIPQGDLGIDIFTMKLSLPDFPDILRADIPGGNAAGDNEYLLFLYYRLIFSADETMENRISMRISLADEENQR